MKYFMTLLVSRKKETGSRTQVTLEANVCALHIHSHRQLSWCGNDGVVRVCSVSLSLVSVERCRTMSNGVVRNDPFDGLTGGYNGEKHHRTNATRFYSVVGRNERFMHPRKIKRQEKERKVEPSDREGLCGL